VAAQPSARVSVCGCDTYTFQAFSARRRVAIDILQAKGILAEMDVSVGEAGQDHTALQVFQVGAGKFLPQLIKLANGDHAAAAFRGGADGKGCGFRVVWVQGVNACVMQDQHF
jgi:hypothetical protein